MRSGKQTVGIVGLGIMGGAFARNLVASGFRVIGFDVDPAGGAPLARPGSKSRQTPRRSPRKRR